MSTGELLSAVGNKAAIASIAANVGIAASIKAGLVGLVGSWGLSDTAIVITMCVSIMLFFLAIFPSCFLIVSILQSHT